MANKECLLCIWDKEHRTVELIQLKYLTVNIIIKFNYLYKTTIIIHINQ